MLFCDGCDRGFHMDCCQPSILRRPKGLNCSRRMICCRILKHCTHTHPFNGPFSRTTRVSWYQKGKTNLDFTEARDSEWRWHQLGHLQVCISLQTDNHASTPPLKVFYRLDALPAAQPTASKHWRQKSTEGKEALKANFKGFKTLYMIIKYLFHCFVEMIIKHPLILSCGFVFAALWHTHVCIMLPQTGHMMRSFLLLLILCMEWLERK